MKPSLLGGALAVILAVGPGSRKNPSLDQLIYADRH
jgi:hypothetical protein